MIKATVYATVDNDEQVDVLVNSYNIPKRHIFKSHDVTFVSEIMAITGGKGVDVVVNSLSGDLLSASFQCVAKRGKLIHLIQHHSDEDGNQLLHHNYPDLSYSVVDIMDYIESNPEEGERYVQFQYFQYNILLTIVYSLLRTTVELYERGHIRPIEPARMFSWKAVNECFQCLQAGLHDRKLMITINNQETFPEPNSGSKSLTFRTDASYLLVGGLGGLGRGLARWMTEHGATELIFLSRSAGDAEADKLLFRELESCGCSAIAIKGNVCQLSDVQKAISSAGLPLKGIFNISMVLQDDSLLKMSLDKWKAATDPKVQGTWNLHEASLDLDLDFFLLFSSMCGVLGMPGQANYAAANSFMDAFVQYRHQLQLPACVLDLGAVEGIGHVAKNPRILERSKWLNYVRMTQRELFETITVAISNGLHHQNRSHTGYVNSAQIITGFRSNAGFLEPLNHITYYFDRRLATYSSEATDNTTAAESTSGNKLTQFVASAAKSRDVLSQPLAESFVATQIAKWVFDLLMKPVEDDSEIDLIRSLPDVGLDSLAAVEMRSWWKKTFGFDIGVLEIMSFASFAALGEHAVNGLTRKFWSEDKA